MKAKLILQWLLSYTRPGKKNSQDGRLFKSRRKNAKEVNEETGGKLYPQSSDEVNNLYSYPIDNTLWDCS